MKPHLLCLPCTVRTAYDVAKRATKDEDLQKKVVLETIKWIASQTQNYSNILPNVFHTKVCRIAKEITGNPDPFLKLKRITNKRALKVLPILEGQVQRQKRFEDAFKLAVKGSICGNAIDFEVESYRFNPEDFERILLNCLKEDLSIDDTNKLAKLLSKSSEVLYLLDNAGEIVFDKLLIKIISERYRCKIFAAVKEGAVLNDATLEDAKQIGLDEIATIITTGNDHIGICLEESSREFLNRLREADIVVAKGQGYYESLTEINLGVPRCYVLRAKCIKVAEELKVPINGNVVKVA